MSAQRGFRSFAEFERELIRPNFRAGWSVDELEETDGELDFDCDPFESRLEAGGFDDA